MSATLIEWLIGVLFLAMLLLLIAARIFGARRNSKALHDAHWPTGTVSPGIVDGGSANAGSTAGSGDGGST